MISDEAYRSSTQYRHFSFPSKEKLNAQRARANANAQSRLPPEISYLTVDEDIELIDHYVTKLWELCRHFRAKSAVRVPLLSCRRLLTPSTQVAATSFLLRYYLHNTPLTIHPHSLYPTALFLASKTENEFIPLDRFKSHLPANLNIDESQITTLEFPLSTGIQFSFTIWSCLRALWGFGLEITTLLNEGAFPESIDKDRVKKVLDDARSWASESSRTDAQFLYTPPQIALACIRHYNKEIVRLFVDIKFPPGMGAAELGQRLLQTVEECEALIAERLGVIARRKGGEIEEIETKLARCIEVLDSMEHSAKRKADSADEREAKKSKSD